MAGAVAHVAPMLLGTDGVAGFAHTDLARRRRAC
jgi:hypothetical protein